MQTVYNAEPVVRGSRVEVCQQEDLTAPHEWFEAVVVQIGKGGRNDQIRVQFAAPGEEPTEDALRVSCLEARRDCPSAQRDGAPACVAHSCERAS